MLKNMSWKQARDLLLEQACPVNTETVSLEHCGGRILAEDAAAREDVPPFDRSAYDGYALIAADTRNAAGNCPVTLQVTEILPAGTIPSAAIRSGQAVRLMTGAPVPEGADTIINYEKTTFTDDSVTLFGPLSPGANIVRKGEDICAGSLLAARGSVIDPGLAGSLAAQGFTVVPVYRRPLIGLIATGSEIVETDSPVTPGKLRNSSRTTLTVLLEREGCRVCYLGHAADDTAAITALIRNGLASCDAVLLTGGVSAGDWDLTPEAMTQAGTELLVDGIAMKPGMACVCGRAEGKLVIGLSGNPASAFTTMCVCVLPAIRKLCGRSQALPVSLQAVLADDFTKPSRSDRFLRGKICFDNGRVQFRPSSGQGNAVLSGVIGCDAFVMIPAGSGPVKAGEILSGFML